MFSMLGTPTNIAVHGYLNDNKVPQLFVATGADQVERSQAPSVDDGFTPSYAPRRASTAATSSKSLPDAKIAVLYQNDDFGKDYLTACATVSATADKMIVATKSYETTDPTVDSQIVALQASGANVLLTAPFPNSPPRRSARSTISAGSLPISSAPSRVQSEG